MGTYNRADILRLVEDENVQFIRMQFTDIFGQLKNVAVTASQIGRALDGEIMLDGSSIQDSARVEESDQYLHPELDTFAILPWRPQYGKVARLIFDVYNPDGTPFDGDPRNILKRTLKRAENLGYRFHVGPELEFFLFQTDEEGRPTVKTSDEAGYFDLGPLDHGESTRREVALALEKMGVAVEASHHEAAAGQHEIDLKYTDALAAADNIMTFKLAVKTLAQKNGLHATFMPKPIQGAAGNGMHVNMSLFRDGRNLFYDEGGEQKAYLQPKHVELFSKHRVFTEEELTARNEIHLENYCEVIGIEARTMIDMVKRDIFPAVSRFSGATASSVAAKKSVLADLDCSDEENLLKDLSRLTARMMKEVRALEDALAAPKGKDAYEAAHYYRYTVFDIMGKLRAIVDELETMTAAEAWPYPSYTDLLFSVK